MTTILTLPQIANQALTIPANADWRQEFPFVDSADAAIDLTGIAFHMQIRLASDASAILADLKTGGEGLTVDGAGGVVKALLTADQTKMLVPYAGQNAVADILAIADGAIVNLAVTPLQVQIAGGVTWP